MMEGGRFPSQFCYHLEYIHKVLSFPVDNLVSHIGRLVPNWCPFDRDLTVGCRINGPAGWAKSGKIMEIIDFAIFFYSNPRVSSFTDA